MIKETREQTLAVVQVFAGGHCQVEQTLTGNAAMELKRL